jgi:SAM-dependent methyltransferase
MNVESKIAKGFAEGFLSVDLETQISHCDFYEILPDMLSALPKHGFILEAGAGPGRWVIYLHRKGYRIVGIDWSKDLCDYARRVQPDVDMREGDLRSLPFSDRTFAAIIALGSVEHVQEGPLGILREFNRCLKDDGIVILTVPYFSPLRQWLLPARAVLHPLRGSRLLRVIFGKTPLVDGAGSCKSVLVKSVPGLWTDVDLEPSGWYFYQYRFTKRQIIAFLEQAGFAVERVWISFGPEGMLHDFRSAAGRFDYQSGKPRLRFIARILLRLLPEDAIGLMVCCIARKKTDGDSSAQHWRSEGSD